MTYSNDLLSSAFCDALLSYLTERELHAPQLAQKLQALTASPSMSATYFCDLLESISQIDSAPALGLRIGQGVKPQNFGVVGHLALSCNNLGQALTRYRRFQQLLQTGLKSQLVQQGYNLHISWTQQAANTPLAYEFSVAAFVRLYQTLIGKNFTPINVGLPYAKPKDTHIHEAIMGCPVHFDTDCLYVEIPARLMAMRISSSDTYLRKLFEQQALAMLEQPATAESDLDEFNERLQQQIISALQNGQVNAKATAQYLGYSLRSFYRKLNQSGHSFRSVVADIRMRLAKHYLSDPALSHLEIALLLGYSEQSSFIRAFKGWMGITPQDYRKRINKRNREVW